MKRSITEKTVSALLAFAAIILSFGALAGCQRAYAGGKLPTNARATDKKFAAAYTEFALELLRGSAPEGQNALISPLSVMEALAMTASGAGGVTLSEMLSVMGGIPTETLAAYLRAFSPDSRELSLANSIWIKNDFAVRGEFTKRASEMFGAGIYSTPFDASGIKKINSWVRGNTRGMIPELVDGSTFGDATMLCLINAIAFEGKWAAGYADGAVGSGTFNREDGAAENVTMLRSSETRLINVPGGIGFAKDYNGGRYSFVAILPDKGTKIADFVASLDAADLADALRNTKDGNIIARIPEFGAEYSADLGEILCGMGMPSAFRPGEADFSGISSDMGLYIDSVIHKTKFELDRTGTKAAAATSVTMNKYSAPPERRAIYITLDRPFVYMIIDGTTSLPVFIGTYAGAPD